MKAILVIFLGIISPFLCFSQTIKGKITNEKGEKIPLANVMIKDSVNSEEILEFVIARNGEYSITLQKNYAYIVIEVTAFRYAKEYIELQNLSPTQTYIRDFVLLPEEEKIEEITIKSNAPVFIKGDTTTFNVAAFSDGTERKIEDIIKKLPGIQVNEKTGEIKYKGRSIETVKLDGDDLFGSNYAIGTRNINANMVEQIQAIENYSENPLLKGIEDSDKVVLNLKLKKGIDLSGDVSFANGLMEQNRFARDIGGNLLGVSQKYKSFANISFNNIGINRTPFDYFSTSNFNPEQLKERNFYASRIIPEMGFSTQLDDKRMNINRSLFSSYNHTFKIRQKVTLKQNFYFISDRISSVQEAISENRISGITFTTRDDVQLSKKPTQYRADTDFKWSTSPNSLLEYNFKIRQENIHTPYQTIQNNSQLFLSDLDSRDFYYKQKFTYTFKFAPNKVFQVFAEDAQNSIRQDLLLAPSLQGFQKDNQSIFSARHFSELKGLFMGSYKEMKYSLGLGGTAEKNTLQTFTQNFQNDTVVNRPFENDLLFQKNIFFQNTTFSYKWKRFYWGAKAKLSYLQQNMNNFLENSFLQRSDWLIDYFLTLHYKVNSVALWNVFYHYQPQPFSVNYFYEQPVLLSARSRKSNEPGLHLQNMQILGTLYSHNDFFEQFLFQLGLNHYIMNGNYFSRIDVQPNQTQTIYFFLPQDISSTTAYFNIEKYLRSWYVLVKGYLSYSYNVYKNIVNNSDLRQNFSHSYNAKVELKTAFKMKLNFQNIFSYSVSRNIASNARFENQNLSNSFSVIYRINSSNYLWAGLDYFLPNTQNPQNAYRFVDIEFRHTLKERAIDLSLHCKNLFNESFFEQIQTSDFAIFTYRNNLLPRYFLLSVSCSF